LKFNETTTTGAEKGGIVATSLEVVSEIEELKFADYS
jgi:hypothetical protein